MSLFPLNLLSAYLQKPGYANREMICKDKLHPNEPGVKAIADSIPLDFFPNRKNTETGNL